MIDLHVWLRRSLNTKVLEEITELGKAGVIVHGPENELIVVTARVVDAGRLIPLRQKHEPPRA